MDSNHPPSIIHSVPLSSLSQTTSPLPDHRTATTALVIVLPNPAAWSFRPSGILLFVDGGSKRQSTNEPTDCLYPSLAKKHHLRLAGLKRATCHVPFGPSPQIQPNLLLAESTFLHCLLLASRSCAAMQIAGALGRDMQSGERNLSNRPRMIQI